MYKPKFNHVLVEIVESLEAKYNKNSGNENMGGEVYREGKVIEIGLMMPTRDYPGIPSTESFNDTVINEQVMWNEGHEAGTVHEHDGKKYALIYWWDIIGVKDEQ